MPDPLLVLAWTGIAFASGSLMFSHWISRRVLKRDLRGVGDGNPGSTNVLKAGGFKWGALAFLLDYLKGVIPVALARYAFGIYGFALLPVAIGAILGHAYSPWLGFRGGKAVAVTAGVWTAITLWEAPTLGGVTLGIWFSVIPNSGWTMTLTMSGMLLYYLFTQGDPSIHALVAFSALFLIWKYRADLRKPPGLRGWVRRRLRFAQ
jgi:glycerol-3-phosphate acyltransferase PlsY